MENEKRITAKRTIIAAKSKRLYMDKTGLSVDDVRETPASEINGGDYIVVNVGIDMHNYAFELHVAEVTMIVSAENDVNFKPGELRFY